MEKKLQPTVDTWYPKIIEALPSKDFTPPASVVDRHYRRLSRGGGDRREPRRLCAAWFKRNYNGEGAGAVVHELVHVGAAVRSRPGRNTNPGWLVEGMADYIRWFKYEPTPTGTRPNPDRAKYTDSYRMTAGFLNYVAEKHDKEIVVSSTRPCARQYSADLWKEYTGKTVDELWKEYVATLR